MGPACDLQDRLSSMSHQQSFMSGEERRDWSLGCLVFFVLGGAEENIYPHQQTTSDVPSGNLT